MNAKNKKITAFINSGTYKWYLSRGKAKSQTRTEKTFQKSEEYKNSYVQGVKSEEYKQYGNIIRDENITYNEKLEQQKRKLEDRIEQLENKIIINIKEVQKNNVGMQKNNEKMKKNNEKVQKIKPQLYLFSTLITLSLTLISSIILQIKAGGFFEGERNDVILVILCIFVFSLTFLLLSGLVFNIAEGIKKIKK